jgi:hypothetical protein
VIGFSQGAAIAATVMLERLQKDPFASEWFHVAIFICGGVPLRALEAGEDGREDSEEQWSCIDPVSLPSKNRIRVQTVHIFGSRDHSYEDSLRLRDFCDPATRLEFDHGGGHEIPRSPRVTQEMAKMIRKAIHKAFASF